MAQEQPTPRPLTFEESVAEVRIVTAPGAAIEVREYKLTPAGRAALSGQRLPTPTLPTEGQRSVDAIR